MNPHRASDALTAIVQEPTCGDTTFYAQPRPLMRSGYLVRSTKAVTALRMIDRLLAVSTGRRGKNRPPAEPQRILVSNWAHLGDVLTSLPTLRLLRESFPRSRIDLIVGRHAQAAVEGSRLYDHLYRIDHFLLSRAAGGLAAKHAVYLQDKRQFLAAAPAARYEVAIDLYPYFPPAAPLFWQARIPIRCGFTSGGFGPLLTHPVPWVYQAKSISQYGGDLVAALWAEAAPATGHLAPYWPSTPGLATPSEEPPTHAPLMDAPYVVLHIGTGAAWKEWPEDRWRELVQRWPADAPRLVICGRGEEEVARARRIADAGPPGRSVLFIDRPWRDFAALLAGAAGLICLESAACHLAAAFSLPTVAIYSGVNEHRLWGPDNPNARLLTSRTACAPCHRAGCATMACIRGVSTDEVLAAIGSLIGLGPSAPDAAPHALEPLRVI
jgi:ADP-heptose:LPS heptosyltransferase